VSLTDTEREIVRLIDAEGASYTDIADVLDESQAFVRHTIARLCRTYDCVAADLPARVVTPTDGTRAEKRARRLAGVCLNCGAALVSEPEMNLLTGRQLRRNGVLVVNQRCGAGCGYRKGR
jgi:hypothetical protein